MGTELETIKNLNRALELHKTHCVRLKKMMVTGVTPALVEATKINRELVSAIQEFLAVFAEIEGYVLQLPNAGDDYVDVLNGLKKTYLNSLKYTNSQKISLI